jgi:hypothetical protein
LLSWSRSLYSRLGFRCGVPFDVHERGYKRDLELDLLATPRGTAGQSRDLIEGASELRHSLYQRRD